MRPALLALGSILAALSPAPADDAALADFLQRFPPALLASEQALPLHRDQGDPPIVLLRFRLDVTGDGIPETFLGSSEAKDRSVDWTLYAIRADQPIRLGDGIRLPPSGFFLRKHAGATELHAYQRSASRAHELYRYRFEPDGRWSEEIESPDGHARLFLQRNRPPPGEDYGKKVRPSIERLPLGAHLSDAATEWEPYNYDTAPHRQFAHRAELPPAVTADPPEATAPGGLAGNGAPAPTGSPDPGQAQPHPEARARAGVDAAWAAAWIGLGIVGAGTWVGLRLRIRETRRTG